MKKQIIILAKSIKHFPNYCIAGIDVETGKWIRPISSFDDIEGAVPLEHLRQANGEELNILDVVEIDFIKHVPSIAQSENYIYNENIMWKKVGEIGLEELINIYGLSDPEYIFENTDKELSDIDISGESLLFVKIQDPVVFIKTFDKKKIQLCFTYMGRRYNYFRIEDPTLKQQFWEYDDGIYNLDNEMYAVFSLTGKWNVTGKYYKILANIF